MAVDAKWRKYLKPNESVELDEAHKAVQYATATYQRIHKRYKSRCESRIRQHEAIESIDIDQALGEAFPDLKSKNRK